MKRDNPCWNCPDSGCGRHGECEKYLEYYEKNRERYKEHEMQSIITGYQVNAIEKQKAGLKSTANRYRPKER